MTGDPVGKRIAAQPVGHDGSGDDDDAVADNDDDDGSGDDDDDAGGTATPPAVRNGSRISGADRILTAVAISQSQFDTAFTVYLANANGFADAVSGGVLTDGPILLVDATGALRPEVCAEITRVSPTDVVALGGTAAISDNVLAQATAC